MRAALVVVTGQGAWWGCVLGAGSPWVYAGIGLTLVLALVHATTSAHRRREVALILTATVVGIAVDSLLVVGGALRFDDAVALGPLPTPLWMVALWTGFGASLSSAFSFVLVARWKAAAFGAAVGPIAYAGGTRLVAMHLGAAPASALVAIAAGWGVAMVVLQAVYAPFSEKRHVTPPRAHPW